MYVRYVSHTYYFINSVYALQRVLKQYSFDYNLDQKISIIMLTFIIICMYFIVFLFLAPLCFFLNIFVMVQYTHCARNVFWPK